MVVFYNQIGKVDILLSGQYMLSVERVRWVVNAIIICAQVYIIHKYNIVWYDWLIWGLICVGGYTVLRISSVTEGIVETIAREEMYKKVKKMLFKDDKRNTKD